ncbi:MAG: hypothetical protein E7623_04270 [Ruminococcaceae bacterium]|nr:hypothetical protein [Oscillospiraceae bacterium]
MKKLAVLLAILFLFLSVSCGYTEKESSSAEETTEEESLSNKSGTAENETETEQKKIKVACVGDSLTYGVGCTDTEKYSYPAHLAELLGEDYVVSNFGYPGSTAMTDTGLGKENSPYLGSEQYRASVDFEPDVVVIMLGTNDAILMVTDENNEKFLKCLKNIIDIYTSLDSTPTVYLATSPSGNHNEKLNERLTARIVPLQKKAADDMGVTLIDIFSATKSGSNLFYFDSVHFNSKGYSNIANIIYENIIKAD